MMTPTNFMMMSFRLFSGLPIGLSSPPQADTQKPKMMAKMIRGEHVGLIPQVGEIGHSQGN